jgi:hypothetical protein
MKGRTKKIATFGHCLVCDRNLLDERRCTAFRRSRKHKDTCRCGHMEADHELLGEIAAPSTQKNVQVPPHLLRVARACDELRDALLAALSGQHVSGGVMRVPKSEPPTVLAPVAEVERSMPVKKPLPESPRVPDKPEPRPIDTSRDLPLGAERILTVIAQALPGDATRKQIAVLTGYKTRSITTYLSVLRQLGLIFQHELRATEQGIVFLGPDFKRLPTGDKLREHWLRELSGGERKLFEIIIGCYPGSVDRARLRESTDYADRSITTYISLLVSRRIITKVGREWSASDELFSKKKRAA